MIILGLDLSMNSTGYALIEYDGMTLRLIKKEIIKAKAPGIADLVFDDISEYAPTRIKKHITGNRQAKKKEVGIAVIERLAQHGIVYITFKTDDESDTIVVALTYYILKG